MLSTIYRCEVAHSCIDGATFVLIMKLLTCCNYSYVLSTINCLTFTYSRYSISIYLAQCTYFLFFYRSVPISYSFIADRMEQHFRVTGLSAQN